MQLLQIDVPTEALEPEVTESTLSILSLMTNGGIGAQIIMSILFIMSIMAIYLFVSRLSAIKRSSQMDSKFMDDIKDYITHGNLQSATNLCERSDTYSGTNEKNSVCIHAVDIADIPNQRRVIKS